MRRLAINIELRHLRYFLAVAEELNFGRAAEKLNISQPPLSQQIQALEAQIGATLFERNNRNVRLRPRQAKRSTKQAGEYCTKWSRHLRTPPARLKRGEIGELRIGFTSSAPFIRAVSRSLLHFRQRYPDVYLQMLELNTKQQIDPLLSGKLDIGVMRNNPLPADLQHQLLLHEALVAVVHETHALAGQPHISVRQLANEPFVFFAREVGTALYDEILRLLKNYAIDPYITQEVGEAMTIVGLVSAGLGVSILPASFLRISVDGVKYVLLSEPDATTEVWLVTSRRAALNPAANTLISFMLEQDTGEYVHQITK